MSGTIGYRADIDGLRAVAVGLVVLYHALPGSLPGGFVGVDVFFVISGYLITAILLDEIRGGRFSLAGFYERRVRRLFPALVLVLAATLGAGYVVLLPGEFEALGKHTAAGAVYISNNVLRREAGYFDVAAELKPLLHLWSLAVEEQFYIVWPLILAGVARSSSARIPHVVAGIAAVSLAASVMLSARHPIASFFMPHTRLWELALGGLLAAAPTSWRLRQFGRGALPAHVLSVAGAAMIATAAALFSRSVVYPGAAALVPCMGAALVIAAGPGGGVNRLLALPPVVFLGLVSYPFYLWHWPILSYLAILGIGPSAPGVRLAAVALALVLAVATYLAVERPVRRRPGRSVVLVLLGAMAALGVLGLLASAGVLKPRLHGTPLAVREEARQDWRYPRGLQRLSGPPDVLHYGKGTGAETVYFVGDSNIEQYWPRVERLLEGGDGGRRVRFATYGGCPPVPGIVKDDGRCAGFAERALALAEAADVKAVVLGAAWEGYFTHGGYRFEGNGDPLALTRADDATVRPVMAALDAAVARLKAQGKDVWIVLTMPSGTVFDPMYGVARAWWGADPAPLAAAERSRVGDAAPAVRQALREIGRSRGATVVDPADHVCDAVRCPAADPDGRPRYKDSNHFRATFVAEQIRFLDRLFPARE